MTNEAEKFVGFSPCMFNEVCIFACTVNTSAFVLHQKPGSVAWIPFLEFNWGTLPGEYLHWPGDVSVTGCVVYGFIVMVCKSGPNASASIRRTWSETGRFQALGKVPSPFRCKSLCRALRRNLRSWDWGCGGNPKMLTKCREPLWLKPEDGQHIQGRNHLSTSGGQRALH